jgi:hypothetical protein
MVRQLHTLPSVYCLVTSVACGRQAGAQDVAAGRCVLSAGGEPAGRESAGPQGAWGVLSRAAAAAAAAAGHVKGNFTESLGHSSLDTQHVTPQNVEHRHF